MDHDGNGTARKKARTDVTTTTSTPTVTTTSQNVVTLLDYGTGNVCSLRNAVKKLGYSIIDVSCPEDIQSATKLIFPGVGSFDAAMQVLNERKWAEPLKQYIADGKPFFGICLGMQVLFDGSEEGKLPGLGVIPGIVKRFSVSLSVPHMGWNGIRTVKESSLSKILLEQNKYYFVHSYCALPTEENKDWVLGVTDYEQKFISVINKGLVMATQCHPEKSSVPGLALLEHFLTSNSSTSASLSSFKSLENLPKTTFAKRIIACLDVRSNDSGDLVVTKGDQYDVREKEGNVRNLGKPVELASRYYLEGADEITFLNITSFRSCPLSDVPMLEVLQRTSKEVFVPLTIGGGIRDYTDANGKKWSAVDVADRYFRSGADKVSIGSAAVLAAEKYIKSGKKTGDSLIEAISNRFGAQAVVISIDPRRVYVKSPDETKHHTIKTSKLGPNGEEYCWYQCTIRGGREGRELDAYNLAKACEALGAGEILLNCIDHDGTKGGFNIELIKDVSSAVSIPVIASSGAGKEEHFSQVLLETGVEAALAAGIFHRKEVSIHAIKKHLEEKKNSN